MTEHKHAPDDHFHPMKRFVANLLRVMRGGGEPMSVIGGIEAIAEATKTHDNYNDRTCAAQAIVSAARSWDDDLIDLARRVSAADGYDSINSARQALKINVCNAALRLMASEIEGNGTESSKAESDLWGAINAYNQAVREDHARTEKSYLEELAAESNKSIRADNKASRGNAKVLDAANDNGVGSFVYFITDGDAIKIGKANNPKSRLSGLQTSHHKPLRILALMPGGEASERALHGKFHRYRIRGEWFKDCREIRNFINSLTPVANDNEAPERAA
ncbi:GIY-YIG nuclease family protein [Sinorhizobium meliloti]|uniref:GIY-YIG nuclease family protein n=1 Tax=Rhizobium meliloti TaxID=382 RepID=UPI00067EB977|nr:GIY-YIG nuclease family protein [Sinorhizobium meliloti]